MNRALTWMMLVVSAFVPLSTPLIKADESTFDRKEDVIYGRKHGTALTMDVFTPTKDARGIGVIFVVSGGFFSSHEAINSAFVRPLIDRGFTVFRAGVETTLAVKKGAGHGWPGLDKDLIRFADWFDKHLKKPTPGS